MRNVEVGACDDIGTITLCRHAHYADRASKSMQIVMIVELASA
jgi:hypothetical protein